MTLKELKQKYSGQAIPEWELIAAGLKESSEPAPRKPGRPRKEVIDGDSDAN